MICKLKSASRGHHIEVRVFMGPDKDHLALAGVLMMRVGEYQLFAASLLMGSRQTHGQFALIEEGGEAALNPPEEKNDDPRRP